MREEFHINTCEEQKHEVLRACGSSFYSRKVSEMLEEETEKEEHTEIQVETYLNIWVNKICDGEVEYCLMQSWDLVGTVDTPSAFTVV